MLDSIQDWIVLAVIAIILFGGGKRIPELFRNLGRGIGEFRRGQQEVEAELKAGMRAGAAAETVPAGTGAEVAKDAATK